MKVTLEHRDVRSTDVFDGWVEEQILGLENRLQIDEATVRLERDRAVSPEFRVQVHLVTPGPDVLAYGCDHTLRAAVNKALRQLDQRISRRSRKPVLRVKSNLSAPAELSRGRRHSPATLR